MAYTTSTLSLASQPVVDRKKWFYTSADGTSLVSVSSYITDATQKGLSAGDSIEQYSSGGTPPLISYLVKTVRSSVTSGSADLSSGISLSSSGFRAFWCLGGGGIPLPPFLLTKGETAYDERDSHGD